MAYYFKCPHCGKGSFDDGGENEIDCEKGLFKCEWCGNIISFNNLITYEEYAELENLI